ETLQRSSRFDRLVILRDSRIPISKGAVVTQQRIATLEQQGAVFLYPTVEVLAALDALGALLADAKSGNLALHGESVDTLTFEKWFLSNLPDELRDFTESLFQTPSGPRGEVHDAGPFEAMSTLLADQPVMKVSDAAESLELSADSVAD